eukprot:8250126-Pyramimonas_sp.AAC.1
MGMPGRSVPAQPSLVTASKRLRRTRLAQCLDTVLLSASVAESRLRLPSVLWPFPPKAITRHVLSRPAPAALAWECPAELSSHEGVGSSSRVTSGLSIYRRNIKK